jgi:CHAT domain-containing protein/Flp pilus assembly protein TadD
MNAFRLLILICIPALGTAQMPDSMIITNRVDSLIKVSRSLLSKMEYQKAMEVNTIAENLVVEKFGKESVEYGNICFNKGRILKFKGDYPEAEKCYLDSKRLRLKYLGDNHPEYAWSLNNLAAVYLDLGNYEKAEPLYIQAKSIREHVLGKDHPDYAGSLNNLANLYVKMGNYEKAEWYYLESKSIKSKLSGEQSAAYASSLNNLANLYVVMGNYEKAEPLYTQAKSILEAVLGKEHPDYSMCLNNLATVYWNTGNHEQAEHFYLETKSIREKTLGRAHPEYASCLNNLAWLYLDMGNYEKAEPLYLESRNIREKALGKNHPDYATSLNSLANLYLRQSKFDKAEPLFQEAKSIREKILGAQHPDVINSIINVASLYWARNDYGKAELNFINAAKLEPSIMIKAMNHLSEREMNKFLLKNKDKQSRIFSFAQNALLDKVEHSDIFATCFNNLLFYKGFLLNADLQIRRLAQTDSSASEKLKQLKVYGRQLAAEMIKPLAEQKNVSVLESKTNDLEKELSREVSGFGEVMKQMNWQDVQNKLKVNEAAIEFIHYNYYDKIRETDKVMYAALILKSATGQKSQPEFITLFEEKSIDSLLKSKSERRADYVNMLYTVADRGVVETKVASRSLYDLIWKPIESKLEGIEKIFYSPSGLLHRINVGAIPIAEEQTLNDKYVLVELSSTRQLVQSSANHLANEDAMLMGGIQYDLDTNTMNGLGLPKAELKLAGRGGHWNFLKWTEREVNTLIPILESDGIKAISFRGFEATEDIFKTIGTSKSSPRILHIATHGYFFPDRTASATGRMSHDSATSEGTANAASINPQIMTNEESVFKNSDHPMIRSGLILAGGNMAWKTGKPFNEGMEDGILTAYEISQMNLSNTELVVLSACETGLGDIEGNEGVYGLQRAFKIAGAKYLMMSLWQIPDQETKEFMVAFYKNWLEKKMSIPDAFRNTQREMKERFINPYQWAGFVLVE